MLEKKSLKMQFIIIFVGIILMSFATTAVTYYFGFNIFQKIEYKNIYPANYYEKKLAFIDKSIREKGKYILNLKEKDWIEDIIPVKGIMYEVVDENANIIYGTNNKRILKDKKDLYKLINTTIYENDKKKEFVRVVPILDKGKISGAVLLSYKLVPQYENIRDKIWVSPLFIIILFSPFIYIVIFVLLFSKKFANNIGKPVNMIIDASKKVKNKNLDFNIDYTAKNELGTLCGAFNDMKNELKNSLIFQWKIEQERHEMVEALAHDLKTPFAIIQGCVEFLGDDDLDDKVTIKKYLNMIKNNTDRGSSLIIEMLYASEIENSSLKLNFVPIDIKKFIEEKKEIYEMVSKNKNINFYVNVLDKRKCNKACMVDTVKLDRIFDNIVLNGIRYTPCDGIIKIDVKIDDKNLSFTVGNSGRQFTTKELSNIFNKFYRGDKSRSSKTGHAGLGLYISKQLAEMMGGTIKAYNEENDFACIEFVLKTYESIKS